MIFSYLILLHGWVHGAGDTMLTGILPKRNSSFSMGGRTLHGGAGEEATIATGGLKGESNHSQSGKQERVPEEVIWEPGLNADAMWPSRMGVVTLENRQAKGPDSILRHPVF